MGHYAAEMGYETSYNPFSEEAIEARKRDAERQAKLHAEIIDSFKYIGVRWWEKGYLGKKDYLGK